MGTKYDDKSPFISYSGRWQTLNVPEAYQSSIHSSSSVGATATITFTGTAIRVYGTNPAHINNQPGEMQLEFILNGAVVERWSKGTHHISYYQDRLWDSGNLQDRQHTFTVRNVGSQVPVHFDFFELWGTPVRNEPPKPSPSSSTPVVNRPPPSSTRVVVSTSVQIISSIRSNIGSSTTPLPISSHESSASSSSSESVSSSGMLTSHGTFTTTDAQGREKTVTAFYTIPGTNSGQGGPDQEPPGSVSASKDSGLPRGAIAGIVVGIVLVLIAAAFVLLTLRRRRRKTKLMLPGGEENNVAPFQTGIPVSSRRTLSRSLSDGRTFHRLDNTEDYSSTTTSLSPHNPLQLSHLRAEKSVPLFSAGVAPTETPTGVVPSPILSESEARPFSTSGYSNLTASYDAPPPAYSPEHRQSSTYASAYTSFPPR